MNYLAILLISNITLFQQKGHFVQTKEVIVSIEETRVVITIPFEVEAGYHIQPNVVENSNMLATKVNFGKGFEMILQNQEFIIHQAHRLLLGEEELNTIKTFSVKVTLDKKEFYKLKSLKGTVFYQACNEQKCFFPRELKFDIPLNQ